MTKRDELIQAIWSGVDPLAERGDAATDFQGWSSEHPYLSRAIEEVRPAVVVEIGVWKGGSVITMAQKMRELAIDGAVVAVDTWLGAWDHWIQPQWFGDLGIRNGYPSIYRTFAANIWERGLCDMVVPLPQDSLNACQIFRHKGIKIDVLHIDGGHDFAAVTSDLRAWWPLLREGGILIGDDYHAEGETWPEVREAFQAFFRTDRIEAVAGKCYIPKTAEFGGPKFVR